MSHHAATKLTADDKRSVRTTLPPSTSYCFAMARGQVYHAPFGATSASDWEPLDFRGVIVFGRNTRKYEIQDDASSEESSFSSLGSAEVPSSWGSRDHLFDESDVASLAGGPEIRDNDDLWFRLVEIHPHQKKSAKVAWKQPVLPRSSDYKILGPLFHGFSGYSRLFGFRFEDDDESIKFFEAVMACARSRTVPKPNSSPRPWNRSARRRRTMATAPNLKQTSEPELGGLQQEDHVEVDTKESVVTEGEADSVLNIRVDGPARPKPRRTPTLLGSRRLSKILWD